MRNGNELLVAAGASAGGHMTELLTLLAHGNRWVVQPSVYITTTEQLVTRLREMGQVEVLGECNRTNVLDVIRVVFRALTLAAKHRPDVLITTGSLPLAILGFWVKVFGGKLIWIDSIANSRTFSMSGSYAYRYADLFITQWPELAKTYQRAQYFGQLI